MGWIRRARLAELEFLEYPTRPRSSLAFANLKPRPLANGTAELKAVVHAVSSAQ